MARERIDPQASSGTQIAGIATERDVSAVAELIYGDPLEPPPSRLHVIHPTAVWRGGDGALVTLKINEWSPKGIHDFFVLSLARARADAIVTSGKILREEPGLSHDLKTSAQGTLPGPVIEALGAWRRERLGKNAAPITLVLTSGRGLDFSHPLFHGETSPIIFTSPAGGERLRDRRDAGVDIIAVDNPDLRSAIDFLHAKRHAMTISIETGPSTSAALYAAPVWVRELLLSVYEEPALDERARGGVFLDADRADALFHRLVPPYRAEEASGRWSFSRYLRRPTAQPDAPRGGVAAERRVTPPR